MPLASLLCLLLLASACAPGVVAFQPRVSGTSELVVAQFAETSPLVAAVSPRQSPAGSLQALVIPFRVIQPGDDTRNVGLALTQVFWSQWLTDAVFPGIALAPEALNRGQAEAVRLARERGADLAVTGTVSSMYGGGSTGDSALSLRLEIYDAASGQLVWVLEQAGRMQADRTEDYILFSRRTRLPPEPLQYITGCLAAHMGAAVKTWAMGPEAAQPAPQAAGAAGPRVVELGPDS